MQDTRRTTLYRIFKFENLYISAKQEICSNVAVMRQNLQFLLHSGIVIQTRGAFNSAVTWQLIDSQCWKYCI